MGRIPANSHTNQPITILRQQLGITQKELAAVIGVSTETLSSIETGRIKTLSDALLKKIAYATGGSWNSDAQEWVIGTAMLAKHIRTPRLSRGYYDSYRALFETAPAEEQATVELEMIKSRVDILFKRIPRQQWTALLTRTNDALEELWQSFLANDEETNKAFWATHPNHQLEIRDQAVALSRVYLQPSGVLHHRIEREKRGPVVVSPLQDTDSKKLQRPPISSKRLRGK
jgi:transcriptional regulator with XRE-family HTH domain